MIVIDTQMDTILRKLNISQTKMVEQYAMMSIDEIVEAEAAQGNQQAVAFAADLFTNADKLVELFKLADPNNKFAILSTMTADKLQVFLPLMEDDDLLQGFNFFTEDKLMKLLEELPPEQLVNTVFQMFSEKDIIKLMPDDELNKFLTSTEVDKGNVLKHMKSIPPEYLAQMIENVTGQGVQNMDSLDMVKQIGDFNPLQYKQALTTMSDAPKQQLTLALAHEHKDLYQLFSPEAYTNMMQNQKQKGDVVKAMSVVERDEKIKMLTELPNDLLSIVITQLDARDFADTLITRFPEILAEIVAG